MPMHDTHAYAVRNIIDGDIKTVGHVPCKYLHYVRFLLDEVVRSILCKAKEIADTSRICHSIDSTFSVRRIAVATIYAQTQPTKSSLLLSAPHITEHVTTRAK